MPSQVKVYVPLINGAGSVEVPSGHYYLHWKGVIFDPEGFQYQDWRAPFTVPGPGVGEFPPGCFDRTESRCR